MWGGLNIAFVNKFEYIQYSKHGADNMIENHLDVLIVGAGLSGIGAAVHLQTECPEKSYAIFEGRNAIGGTWDLFRYPGIRSDSDMHTLGYIFKPWMGNKAIADGPNIRSYVCETAAEHGIEKHIRFGHKVTHASWSSAAGHWTLTVETSEGDKTYTAGFLMMCSGYYNYDAGYTPDFEGADTFHGEIVHPQKWTPDINYDDKSVVVIGSGATAVTLVPEMAKDAAHVTMLQRSPSYVVSRPAKDALANALRAILPNKLAYRVTRWKNIVVQQYFYNKTQEQPKKAKDVLLKRLRKNLGDGFDIETDFTPRYNPWEQRLCLVPDGDLFESLKSGDASVKTGHIDKFVAEGIKLKSGEVLKADMIVTATGLDMQMFGGMSLDIDGKARTANDSVTYKGLMFSDVPNLANVFGYTNASWTLKADLTCQYVCRVLKHMDECNADYCVPRLVDDVELQEMRPLSSGYFARAVDKLPREGAKLPWKQHHDYFADVKLLREAPVADGVLQFENKTSSENLASVAAE